MNPLARMIVFVVLLGSVSVFASLPIAAQEPVNAGIILNTIERMVDEVYNQGNLSLIEELIAEDYVHHPSGLGRDYVAESIRAFRAAMPDLNVTTPLVLIEGDKAAVRVVVRGTFEHPLAAEEGAFPPTGRPFELVVHTLVRFNDEGRLVEEWESVDNLLLLQQLGAIPAEAADAAAPETPIDASLDTARRGDEAANRALAAAYTEAVNSGDDDALAALLADDFRHIHEGQPVEDYETMVATLAHIRQALPDLQVIVEDMVAEADWAAARYRVTGTFTGTLALPDGTTIPGNGSAIDVPGMGFIHVNADNQIDLDWDVIDNLAFYSQLGLMAAAEA